jgi:hypothetical protein
MNILFGKATGVNMVRRSKQSKIRAKCPKRPSAPRPKTGAKKDNLAEGFKAVQNALEGDLAQTLFISKIK